MSKYILDALESGYSPDDLVVKANSSIFPPEYSLRVYARPTKDQGNEGSCSAHALASVKEYQERIERNISTDFSTDYFYSQRTQKQFEGMTPRESMELVCKGALPQRYWRSKYEKKGIPPHINAIASEFKAGGYARADTQDQLKQAILNHGVVYFTIPVYNFGDRPWFRYPGEELQGLHAVTLWGWLRYGYLLRNSWGEDWAMFGFSIFPFEDFGRHKEAWVIMDSETRDLFKRNGKLTRAGKSLIQ